MEVYGNVNEDPGIEPETIS